MRRRRIVARRNLLLFSGSSNPELAGSIAARLGVELGAVELETFANGETPAVFRSRQVARPESRLSAVAPIETNAPR